MTDPVVPRRRVPWLFIALAASLVVNAFFVGAIATDMIRLSYAAKRPLNFELRWLQQRLSEDDFATVLAAVEAERPAAESRFARLRQLRNELGVLAAAPEPDRAAIDAKLEEIRTEQRGLMGGLQATILDAVLALPPASREQLATALPETHR
jgi:uncharacterized membrane protein